MAWLYPCTDFTDSYYYQLVTPARFVTPAKAGVQFPRHPGAMIEIPPKFAGKPPVNPEENPPARLLSRGKGNDPAPERRVKN